MEESVVLNLQDIYSRTLLIPVIGSGLSVPFGLPNWAQLISDVARFYDLPDEVLLDISDLLRVNRYLDAIDCIVKYGVAEELIQKRIVELIQSAKTCALEEVDNNYLDLAQMKHTRYMTTNYDEYLNDAIGNKSLILDKLYSMNTNEFPLQEYDGSIIPLHGEISRTDSIIFTRQSYQDLYASKEFEGAFQHIRSHFTFLFLGFSFNDEYFSTMFEHVVGRFNSLHYILLPIDEKENNADKVVELFEKYGVKTLFYNPLEIGHTQAIRSILEDIFKFKDADIDTSPLKKLTSNLEENLTKEEQKIVNQGRKAIDAEQLGEVERIYKSAYSANDFKLHTVAYQVEIIAGLLWYYCFIQDNDSGENLINVELVRPEIGAVEEKFAFIRAQLLLNQRDYVLAKRVLCECRGKRSKLRELLLDVIKEFEFFKPDRNTVSGRMSVYEKKSRSIEEKNIYKNHYEEIKKKYINPETYNLLDLKAYEDCETQRHAYYYLGVLAGQLFHEHQEAIQYLVRANELGESISFYEELGQNYFAVAMDKVRYVQNAKTHEIDMNSLLKAKSRFQYAMNNCDERTCKSIYERSGDTYLRILLTLREYDAFEEFYAKVKDTIELTDEIYLLKAEADAFYYRTLLPEVAEKLNDKDRLFIEFLCNNNQVDFLAAMCYGSEEKQLRKEIVVSGLGMKPENADRRILQIVLDNIFFLRDVVSYEKLLSIYPEDVFDDMRECGFEDELYGRIDVAKEKFELTFERCRDFLGMFHILRGFYIRNRMKEEYNHLCQMLIENPPDSMFQTSRFYAEMIVSEIRDWGDKWNALTLYAKYSDVIVKDKTEKMELEAVLKYQVADFANYEERIEWNRKMLGGEQVPPLRQAALYDDIVKLLLANMKYRQAEEVLEEMKKKHIGTITNISNLVHICVRKQSGSMYVGNERRYYSSSKECLSKISNTFAWCYWANEKYFGRAGRRIIVSIKLLIYIFMRNRQKELEQFETIYVAYAGIINLQNSIWSREDSFLRMILQWLEHAKNVELFAPDFIKMCEYVPLRSNRNYIGEQAQIELFATEHPEVDNLVEMCYQRPYSVIV